MKIGLATIISVFLQEHAVSLCGCCLGLLRDDDGGVITVSESHYTIVLRRAEKRDSYSVVVLGDPKISNFTPIRFLCLLVLLCWTKRNFSVIFTVVETENFVLLVFQSCLHPKQTPY